MRRYLDPTYIVKYMPMFDFFDVFFFPLFFLYLFRIRFGCYGSQTPEKMDQKRTRSEAKRGLYLEKKLWLCLPSGAEFHA